MPSRRPGGISLHRKPSGGSSQANVSVSSAAPKVANSDLGSQAIG